MSIDTNSVKRTASGRSAASGRYARGLRTQRRILETAIEMFGDMGYESVSTRAIARRAAVSLPALQYYFGGKAGLHAACAEYMTADIRERLDPAATQVQGALARADLSRADLLRLLQQVLEPFLEGMAANRPESWVLFFTREQSRRTPAFDVIFERIGARLIGLCTRIIARIVAAPAHDPEVVIRALSIIGQAASIRRGRPLMLRALGWPDFEGERLHILKRVLWRQIEASLLECAPESAASAARCASRRTRRRRKR